MNGKSHTIKRLGAGLALVAALAALLAPASLANRPAVFATDTTNSAQIASSRGSAVTGLATDTTNSARVARMDAVAVPLPDDFATDTLDTARVGSRELVPASDGGLVWGSFGIGIGAALGALAILGAGALAIRSTRVRRPVSA
jgi:hypothetical protein